MKTFKVLTIFTMLILAALFIGSGETQKILSNQEIITAKDECVKAGNIMELLLTKGEKYEL